MVRKRKPTGSSKVAPIRPEVLQRVFEKVGYRVVGQTGSHRIMKHPEKPLLISIPFHPGTLLPSLIRNEIGKAGLSVEKYLRLLREI
jgi:predicted RNA binding protein YcfA (HicA-like mRNA interferase family)